MNYMSSLFSAADQLNQQGSQNVWQNVNIASLTSSTSNAIQVTSASNSSGTSNTEDTIAALLDINCIDASGRTAIHWACATGSIDIIKRLLCAGASFDAQTINEETPLILAAKEGLLNVCELLLSAGANVDLTDHMDRSARQFAEQEGHMNIAELIDTHKNKLNASNLMLSQYSSALTPNYATTSGYKFSHNIDKGRSRNSSEGTYKQGGHCETTYLEAFNSKNQTSSSNEYKEVSSTQQKEYLKSTNFDEVQSSVLPMQYHQLKCVPTNCDRNCKENSKLLLSRKRKINSSDLFKRNIKETYTGVNKSQMYENRDVNQQMLLLNAQAPSSDSESPGHWSSSPSGSSPTQSTANSNFVQVSTLQSAHCKISTTRTQNVNCKSSNYVPVSRNTSFSHQMRNLSNDFSGISSRNPNYVEQDFTHIL